MYRCIPLLMVLLTGCGGYAHRSQAFRSALDTGAPEAALERVNRELGVAAAENIPRGTESETPLLLLERATILQAMGRYALSARDFQRADKALDVLDLTGDSVGEISRYLFSDDDTLYKAPPHEKLLINTLNMVNYLARGQASGAKVEARRFQINRRYLGDQDDDDGRSFLAIGSFLAGIAFEMAGEWAIAMRHYADAHAAGGVPTLEETIRRLARERGANDPRIKALLAVPPAAPEGVEGNAPAALMTPATPTTAAGSDASALDPPVTSTGSKTAAPMGGRAPLDSAEPRLAARTPAAETPPESATSTPGQVATGMSAPSAAPDRSQDAAGRAGVGTLVVVVQTGMSPHKVPQRVPLANAIIIASQPGYGARLSANERRRAQRVATEGLVKWVNYPELAPPRDARGPVRVEVDGVSMPGGVGLNVAHRVAEQFARSRGTILAAAITRLITRAVVGGVARAVADGSKRDSVGGFLVGLAVEGAMTASDTPDTRSWVTLPARIHVSRASLPVGRHRVGVRFRGQVRTRTIEIKRDGFVVLNFSDLR